MSCLAAAAAAPEGTSTGLLLQMGSESWNCAAAAATVLRVAAKAAAVGGGTAEDAMLPH